MSLYRHGDVLLMAIDQVPADARKVAGVILAHGEVTGHAHRIGTPDAAEMFELDGVRYLRITAPSAPLVHEEHATIQLPEGVYRVWQQREYSPDRIQYVRD